MLSLSRTSQITGAALIAALGFSSLMAKPANADAWIQFGVVAPSPPPAVVVAPPPPAYGYAYSAPYGYSYQPPYYAGPRYRVEVPAYVYGRDRWRNHHGRDRDDWHDDD